MSLSVDDLARGVRSGDRGLLARAITLVESRRGADRDRARELVARLRADRTPATRVGVSGLPGAGKSTLIDALGARLVESGRRPAVLAVDPSSALSGGSILGDKSRMPRLARLSEAYVRPSPSAATLGGVARRTREAALVCEAAGFDPVLIETVGVGQSEAAVADMVDVLVVLLLPGGGDELQGLKKGILELADVVVVHKADGERTPLAREAVRDVSAALRLAAPHRPGAGTPVALAASAKEGTGLDELWSAVVERRAALAESGELEARRAERRERWMWALIEERLGALFRGRPAVQDALGSTRAAVRDGELGPEEAAERLLDAFRTE